MALGEILIESRERVAVHTHVTYPNLGVYSFGRGVFPKQPIQGGATAAPTLYRVRAGQIIYSKLFAFEGAFAVVPAEMDGWFVSNEYPTFDIKSDCVVEGYVHAAILRPQVWAELAAMTVGMGHRRQRLHPAAFLEYEIGLPPLQEQKRISAALHTAGQVVGAIKVEAEAARALTMAIYRQALGSTGWQRARLADVASLDIEKVSVVADEEYPVAGVLIAGRGLFRRETIRGSATNYERLHRLREGQLVYRKLTAWEGPITVVPPEFDGTFVSPEFPTFTLDQSQLLPEFMRFTCRRPSFHKEMRVRSTGTPERRNRLKPTDLLEVEIDLPPLEVQRRVAAATEVGDSLQREAKVAAGVATAMREALLA